MRDKNTYLRLFLLFVLFTVLSGNAFSQQNKSQLAFEYFRNKEFQKASVLFLELYEERSNIHYRNYYIQSLIGSEQLDEAEAFIKKSLRKDKNDLDLRLEQAYVYELRGKNEAASEMYEDIISDAMLTANTVKDLANGFLRKRKYALAEKTYLKAQNSIPGQDFYNELANVYAIQRKYNLMVEAYLDLVNKNESYLENVQTRLQSIASRDVDESLNPILEAALIRRIQGNNSNPVFSELLIWQYIQTGKYELAMQQANALDKRFREKGKRLYELGETAANNGEIEIAKACFNFVYEYGKVSPYYFNAKLIELNLLFESVTQNLNPNQQALLELEKLLETTSEEAPRSLKYPLINLLARVQAFYLNKAESAINLVDSTISKYNLGQEDFSEFLLLKGDIYLIDNNPWEATLVYAKVEQNNKENPYGAEAKFRKAKLAYYTGQFEWAKAQLDVLKASTSKLISNDAFELSLFISENSLSDTLQSALKMFARADLSQFKFDNNSALLTLDSIVQMFPSDDLMDDVLFRKAQIMKNMGDYTASIDLFNRVVTDFSWGILADNALMEIARIQHYKLNDNEAAMGSYTQVLINFKSSIYTVEARKSLRELRGDFPEESQENEKSE
jgi:tetratricopeptide (TPR) repeat protein